MSWDLTLAFLGLLSLLGHGPLASPSPFGLGPEAPCAGLSVGVSARQSLREDPPEGAVGAPQTVAPTRGAVLGLGPNTPLVSSMTLNRKVLRLSPGSLQVGPS